MILTVKEVSILYTGSHSEYFKYLDIILVTSTGIHRSIVPYEESYVQFEQISQTDRRITVISVHSRVFRGIRLRTAVFCVPVPLEESYRSKHRREPKDLSQAGASSFSDQWAVYSSTVPVREGRDGQTRTTDDKQALRFKLIFVSPLSLHHPTGIQRHFVHFENPKAKQIIRYHGRLDATIGSR
jgi:hypothetical protein